jgi:hypothetical protein
MDVLEQGAIELLCDTVPLGRVMHGELAGCTCSHEVLIKGFT